MPQRRKKRGTDEEMTSKETQILKLYENIVRDSGVGKGDWSSNLGAGVHCSDSSRCEMCLDVSLRLGVTWIILRGFGILSGTRTSASRWKSDRVFIDVYI